MSRLILYHGSLEVVQKPQIDKGKVYNDYGRGFYCTEHLELAREWGCNEGVDGYTNQYEIETDNLNILKLASPEYTVLHWLALLMNNRKVRSSAPVVKRGKEWLKEHYLIDISSYDAIVGYRADDSYFSFARSFLENGITLEQLSYAMRLGNLGEQFVIKSQKAFDEIKFISYAPVNHKEYYPKRKSRDEEARAAYRRELERSDVRGIYMINLIQGEVDPDDPRLQ